MPHFLIRKSLLLLGLLLLQQPGKSTQIPSPKYGPRYFAVASLSAPAKWGDCLRKQIIYIQVPIRKHVKEVYFFVHSPGFDVGIDEMGGASFDSKTHIALYGQSIGNPSDSARVLLEERPFGETRDPKNRTARFGPFSIHEGKEVKGAGHKLREFKIVVTGLEGDDINLFRITVAKDAKEQNHISNVIAYVHDFSFRSNQNELPDSIVRLFPMLDPNTRYLKLKNFDMDCDGDCFLRMVAKNMPYQDFRTSPDGEWIADVSGLLHRSSTRKIIELQIKTDAANTTNNMIISVCSLDGKKQRIRVSKTGILPSSKYTGHAIITPHRPNNSQKK